VNAPAADPAGGAPPLRADALLAGPGARALVGISGADHRDWIDRIASAPLGDLPRGCYRRATLMDGKGKLRADLRVIADGPDDGLLLDIPASHAPTLLRVLDMYILRDRVTLLDMSASHAMLSVLGPRAGALLGAAGLPAAPAGDEPGAAQGSVAHQGDVLALPSRLYGVPGTDLFLPAAHVADVEQRLLSRGVERATPEELAAARVAAGVPWFAEDLADGVIPLEAGLDALVSVTKGCSPGQEVVARITNLGQVARKLVRLTASAGTPEAGTTLRGTGERAGQEAGRLTSVAVVPADGRVVALGFVRRPYWPAGTRLLAGDIELEVLGAAGP
jgi:folate-binding protein YgfZ